MTQSLAEDFTEETRRLTRRWKRERSARLEAEAIAERGLREFYEKKEQLQLLEAIATNEPRSVEDALQFALTKVCQTTGWSLGHAYVVTTADNGRRLHSTAIWNGSTAESMRAFRYETELTDFDPSIGLPGRVLATGAPAWIADVVVDSNFPGRKLPRSAVYGPLSRFRCWRAMKWLPCWNFLQGGPNLRMRRFCI